MQKLFADIVIHADAERVWDILMDFESYPDWNPFIKEIEGNASPSERLRVVLQAEGRKPMVFKPWILVLEPKLEFRWLGNLLLPGIFDGEHIFQIEQADQGAVRFIQQEEFRGLLVPFLMRSIRAASLAGFKAMNEALKRRAES